MLNWLKRPGKPPEAGRWLKRRSESKVPNPWEAWDRPPKWPHQATEQIVLAAYYKAEHKIDILKYEQLEIDERKDIRALHEAGAKVGFTGPRGLLIRVMVTEDAAPRLEKLGWTPCEEE